MLLTVSPHHTLEFYHGASLNIGAELRMNDRYNIYGEFGWYLPNSPVANNYEQQGQTFAVEIKRYFQPNLSTNKHYLSAQYMTGTHNYLRADLAGYTEEYDIYTEYEVQKTFQDFSIRYGILFSNAKRFIINPYIGLGIRRHNLESSISEEEQSYLSYQDKLLGFLQPHDWIQAQGKRTYLKVHLGVRIGIRVF